MCRNQRFSARFFWVVFLALATAACRPADSKGTDPFTAALGTLSFQDLAGHPIEVETVGRVTIFLFTRSDCPVSNRYAPTVRRLYEAFHPQEVAFYLVYVDPAETSASIERHLKEYDYPCRAVRDPKHRFVKQSGVRVTPEAVLVDNTGRIAYRGRIDNWYAAFGKARPVATTRELAAATEAVLAGRPVAKPVTEAVGCYIGDLK
jgi:hypothetical protein